MGLRAFLTLNVTSTDFGVSVPCIGGIATFCFCGYVGYEILIPPPGVDLAYLQTGISGAFFSVLNFENLYFLFAVFLDKCCIFKCFIFFYSIFCSSFMHLVLQ